MKKKKIGWFVFITAVLLIPFSFIMAPDQYNITCRSRLKNSAPPIIIFGNEDDDLKAFPGSGTFSDPYKIENLIIDASYSGSCIQITQVTKHVLIRNCTLVHSGIQSTRAGIYLDQCGNITIDSCTIQNNSHGMMLISSRNITISSNKIKNNSRNGIFLEDSRNNYILRNFIHGNNEYGIKLINYAEHNEISANSFLFNNANHYYWDMTGLGNDWYQGIFGNVWGDYITKYPNATNDTFLWNIPYVICSNPLQEDRYPLVSISNIHAPIEINGDAQLDAFPEKTGLGDRLNPYIIQDMRIGAGPNSCCISFKNINKYVVLKNITTTGAVQNLGTGILLENCNNVNLTQIISKRNNIGFFITNVINFSMNLCHGNQNRFYGAYLQYVFNSSITNCQFTDNINDAIYLEFGNNVSISCNYIHNNNENGIQVKNAEFINISKNVESSGNQSGIYLYNIRNTTISQNKILDNQLNGISVESSINCTVNLNTISSARYRDVRGSSIELSNSFQMIISNNSMTNNSIQFKGTIENFVGHLIDNLNTINGKPLIYEYSQNNIDPSLLIGAGGAILVNCTNSTFANLDFRSGSIGIQVHYSSNLTFANSSFESFSDAAIFSSFSSKITVRDSMFLHNNKSMHFSTGSVETRIENNTIRNSKFGIFLRDSLATRITRNLFFKCGLWIEGSDIMYYTSHFIDQTNQVNMKTLYYYSNETFLDNTHFSNAGQIILANCSHCIIRDQNVSNGTNGILLVNCINNTLDRVISSNNNFIGVFIVDSSDNNTISKCVIENNTYGILIFIMCQNNKILHSSILRNEKEGVSLLAAPFTHLENNIVNQNEFGVRIFNSYGTTLLTNQISFNKNAGIRIDSGNGIFILRNNISLNDAFGIYIETTSSSSTISRNFIAMNGVSEAYARSTNTKWDDNGIGNFWGDYFARYPGALSYQIFWSIPYAINGPSGKVDNYPLIWGSDFDGDTILNEDEILWTGTDPLLRDSDLDSMDDGWELRFGFDPLNPRDAYLDPDGDGLKNWEEYRWGTNPLDLDTDKDGFSDGFEVQWGSDPLNYSDTPLLRWLLIMAAISVVIVVVVVLFLKNKVNKKQKYIQQVIASRGKGNIQSVLNSESDSDSIAQRINEKQAILSRIMAPETLSQRKKKGKIQDHDQIEDLKHKKAKSSKDQEEIIERKVDEQLEQELKVELKEEKCVVCEGILKGTSYVCPSCKTKYCIRCAIMLSDRQENCWVCKNRLTFD
ncbi:MAG: right-handed parallel beta-helix repeat-containing protein [Candidatus Sigynarchaeota archaeon]